MKHFLYVSIFFLSSVTFVNGMENKFPLQFTAKGLAKTYRDYKERGMSKQNLSIMIAADRKSANMYAFLSKNNLQLLFDAIDQAEKAVFAEYHDKKQ
jgi:hypothetical protein